MAVRSADDLTYALRDREEVDNFEGVLSCEEEEDNVEEEEDIETEEDGNGFENEDEELEDEELEDDTLSEESARGRTFIRGRNGYKWSQNASEVSLESPQIHVPSPAANVLHIRSPLDAWSELFTDELLSIIVTHTNEKIAMNFRDSDEGETPASRKETDVLEIKAYIGLLYYAGATGQSKQSIAEMWSSEFGVPFYVSVMSRPRFEVLSSVLRFDDKQTREAREASDIFAPIREIWDLFIKRCRENYIPSNNLTIDKQLLGFNGNFSARVYINSRFGIKIISMNDAKTYYMFNAIPYIGKVNTHKDESVPEYYVRTLTEPIYNSNRTVTFDNWFTTIRICDKLRNQYGLHAIGTIRKNNREIPPTFTTCASIGLARYGYDNSKNITLLSFYPKRNKIVLAVSTLHKESTVDISKKPEIIEFYNETKDGVDTFNKMVSLYTTARQTARWPMRVFYGMLDQGGVNAAILYNLITENQCLSRQKFLKHLSISLCKPHLERRLNITSLSRTIRSSISLILNKSEEHHMLHGLDRLEKRKICFFCPTKPVKKTLYCCANNECQRSVCEEHRLCICRDCYYS
ncbi:piggyBac transposable element-derived protein 4-like [Temnothorax longispinosus]|uniref:piggyBac transposable element-derived protein 4-like n=1 Tax=Temnothorax longispinosus TaxID=300112 RepID=UPI003A98F6D8